MGFCKWEGCENYCEGSTDFCASQSTETIYTAPKEHITTDFNVVREAMLHFPLTSLKLKWSWKRFCWVYAFKYDFWIRLYTFQRQNRIDVAGLKTDDDFDGCWFTDENL